MGDVAGRRMTAEIDGDFVVFLIGARINNKLQIARSLLDLGARRLRPHRGRRLRPRRSGPNSRATRPGALSSASGTTSHTSGSWSSATYGRNTTALNPSRSRGARSATSSCAAGSSWVRPPSAISPGIPTSTAARRSRTRGRRRPTCWSASHTIPRSGSPRSSGSRATRATCARPGSATARRSCAGWRTGSPAPTAS